MNIKPGQVWQDADSRMTHRKVLIDRVDGGRVHYVECKPSGEPYFGGSMRASSRLDRFPKAFRLLLDVRT